MHNLKELRKNLDIFKKKLKNRNVDFDISNFEKKDSLNRNLISKKEKLEQEKKILSSKNIISEQQLNIDIEKFWKGKFINKMLKISQKFPEELEKEIK